MEKREKRVGRAICRWSWVRAKQLQEGPRAPAALTGSSGENPATGNVNLPQHWSPGINPYAVPVDTSLLCQYGG